MCLRDGSQPRQNKQLQLAPGMRDTRMEAITHQCGCGCMLNEDRTALAALTLLLLTLHTGWRETCVICVGDDGSLRWLQRLQAVLVVGDDIKTTHWHTVTLEAHESSRVTINIGQFFVLICSQQDFTTQACTKQYNTRHKHTDCMYDTYYRWWYVVDSTVDLHVRMCVWKVPNAAPEFAKVEMSDCRKFSVYLSKHLEL